MCAHAAPPLARGLDPAPIAASVAEAPPAACVPTELRVTRAQLNVLAGESARFSGTLEEAGQRAPAGRLLALQRLISGTWHTLASARTGARGRFSLRYTSPRTGSEFLRIAFRGDEITRSSTRNIGRLEVYRLAGASWYGGGGSLACGGWLTSSTLGVANKTLPCGTVVTLRYDGRTLRVPVIDRGPYVEGREFDLTEATKRELGFGSTGDVMTTS